MDYMERIGRQIKGMRKSKGWTQAELGRQCGVERAQISKIESGTLSKPELRLLKIAELFGCELRFVDSDTLWLHPKREDAYRMTVCELLSTRSVQRIDLLQFSGFTAIPVLETVADHSPDAYVRLLVASSELASSYWHGSDDFHQRRVKTTVDHCDIIMNDVREKNPDAKFTIQVWYYSVTPSIAGIIVDDWLASVGWYRIFPTDQLTDQSPPRRAIAGHNLPAITAIGERALPLLSMVRDQFEDLVANRRPAVSLHTVKSSPLITVSANPTTLWPPNGNMVPVTISGMITDTGSGVNSSTATYAVTDEDGRVLSSGHIALGKIGIYTFTIQLQASHNENSKTKRRYTITVKAQDNALNSNVASISVPVSP